MRKDFHEFSITRLLRFVAFTLSGVALYLAGHDLNSGNLKLASIFLGIAGLIGVLRNLDRLTK